MPSPKYSRFSWALAATLVLIALWIGMLTSLRNTSQTFDEGVHAAAGYTYWRYNDYRFNPENGNLPQRVIGLPLLFGGFKFPSEDVPTWRDAQEWDLAWRWFYELGNDADAMNFLGRAANGLLAVALGWLVWRWSRSLFGDAGGMLSLMLFALNPSILANGALMTSDMAASLFFFAATWSWWRLLQKLSIPRLLLSALSTSALFVSKMSAPLILIVAVVFAVIRVLDRSPLIVAGLGAHELRTRAAKSLSFFVVAAVHGVVVFVVVWGFYGFRYSAFSPKLPPGQWTGETWEAVLQKPPPRTLLEGLTTSDEQRRKIDEIFKRDRAELEAWVPNSLAALDDVKREALNSEQISRLDHLLSRPSPRLVPRILETIRRYRMLPEAYIYGFAHVWLGSLERAAFLNGKFSLSGWPWFFPYTFAVKTPLTLFVILAAAIAGLILCVQHQRKGEESNNRSRLYQMMPLFVLLGVYWIAAILSHLNIGHRHILPTYPPLFVICGAAGLWFYHKGTDHCRTIPAPVARATVSIAVILMAAEVCYRFPHYLAYFNGLVRPASAYRHLVYSSLDWGQDLPQVRSYIENRQPAPPVYLSYFGFASPVYYRVPAIYDYCVPDRYRQPPLQSLTLPAEQADMLLADFLRRNPDYDQNLIGKARQEDKLFAVLIKKPEALRLRAGTYLISASLLEPITRPQRGAFGPWNERLEKEYQTSVELAKPLLSDNPADRSWALSQLTPEQWVQALNQYDFLRFHRLAAFLRQRDPADNIGYSILVFHLTDEDLSRALEGPPVELGPDILGQQFGTSSSH